MFDSCVRVWSITLNLSKKIKKNKPIIKQTSKVMHMRIPSTFSFVHAINRKRGLYPKAESNFPIKENFVTEIFIAHECESDKSRSYLVLHWSYKLWKSDRVLMHQVLSKFDDYQPTVLRLHMQSCPKHLATLDNRFLWSTLFRSNSVGRITHRIGNCNWRDATVTTGK